MTDPQEEPFKDEVTRLNRNFLSFITKHLAEQPNADLVFLKIWRKLIFTDFLDSNFKKLHWKSGKIGWKILFGQQGKSCSNSEATPCHPSHQQKYSNGTEKSSSGSSNWTIIEESSNSER